MTGDQGKSDTCVRISLCHRSSRSGVPVVYSMDKSNPERVLLPPPLALSSVLLSLTRVSLFRSTVPFFCSGHSFNSLYRNDPNPATPDSPPQRCSLFSWRLSSL